MSGKLSKEQRIQLYVDRTDIAISGQEGSKRTMAVARTLYTGFDLSEAETVSWLTKFSARCQPPWSEKEILHKVKSVVNGKTDRKRGWMLEANQNSSNNGHIEYEKKAREPARADYTQAMECHLGKFRCTEADLYDASPIKPSEDFTEDAFQLLENLYVPDDCINCVFNYKINTRADGRQKADPIDSGKTWTRDQAIRSWRMEGLPCSDAGCWIRINPVDGGISDDHVTSFRHMLIEFDKIPVDLQIAFFARFHAPICAILTSGGSSVHAWLKVDCSSRDEFVNLFLGIEQRLIRFGLDTQNKNPSRLSRLVGVTRKILAAEDGRQRLLFLNPNPEIRPIIA
jgi:hypothetical protein